MAAACLRGKMKALARFVSRNGERGAILRRMVRVKYSSGLLLLFGTISLAFAQNDPQTRAMNQPLPPFRIAGNLYYVGGSEVCSFLITTPAGHILLDGGFAETAPQIERNLAQLGFRIEDVKILLNSHAHLDHAGGRSELKQKSGGKFIAAAGDTELLRHGGPEAFRFRDPLLLP